MEKKWDLLLIFWQHRKTKFFLRMKILMVLLLVGGMHLSATTFSQTKVSLKMTDVTVQEVFSSLEKITNYTFLYKLDLVGKCGKVNVDVRDREFDEVLKDLLSPLGLAFTIDDRVVVITARENDEKKDVVIIKGIVKDGKGEALPGVTVVLKGINVGCASDMEGIFTLSAPRQESFKLVFSFVGMRTKEVIWKGERMLNVVLEEDFQQMDEVVVTGYQTISRERATGSFGVVSKRQLDKPAADISSRLIGSTAGVQANLTEDGKATFEIRGRSTLNANVSPLVVVDGFPIEGGFEMINPNDVESVTILKDAAAASVWGARSANGVIVVTTKKAVQNSKLNVSFNAFLKFRQKMDLDYANPTASSEDQIRYEELIFGKYGVTLDGGTFSEDDVTGKSYTWAQIALNEARLGNISQEERDRRLDELRRIDYKDDVYDYLLRNPFLQQYNLSISGGGENVNVLTSMLYEKDKTHYVGTENDKYLLNIKMGADITAWLNLDLSTMFMYVDRKNNGAVLSSSDETDVAIADLSPYECLLKDDGSYTKIVRSYYLPALEQLSLHAFPYKDWYYNPLEEIRSRKRTVKDVNARFQASLTFKLLKGIDFITALQYEMINSKKRDLYYETSWLVKNLVNYYTEYDNVTGTVGKSAYPTGQILDQYTAEVKGYTFRNQLNFNRIFDKHEFNVVLGMEIRHRRTTSHTTPRVYGYNDQTLTSKLFPNGTGTLAIKDIMGYKITVDDYASKFTYGTDRFFSLYGNGAYTYNGKYTLSGSVRTDASNFITDDPKYRYAPFWSIGGMWNISQENFMKDCSFLDWLRVRFTCGYNGNVDTSTSFKPLISIGAVASSTKHEILGSIASFGNPSLRWEKVESIDFGVDYSFWEGKLFGKLDYYRKYSKDLIATVSIAGANGTSSQKLNNAELLNRGIELEVGTDLNVWDNKISWYGNLNYAYNFNRIEKLFVVDNSARTFLRGDFKEGHDASSIYAWHYVGLNKEGIPCVEEGSREDGLRPMNTVYDQTSDASDWLRSQGRKVAPHVLGLTTGFSVCDFDISLIVTGKFGHKFKRSSFNYPTMGRTGTSKIWVHKDVSKLLDGNSFLPPLLSDMEDSNQMYYDSYYTNNIDYLYKNAGHIRFQELNITYHIPVFLLQKIGFQAASIYGQINNLGLITMNKEKNDPEFPEGSVKPERSFIFGVKFNF